MHKLRDSHPTLFFVIPVMLENFLSTGAGLVFSWLIGGISGSAFYINIKKLCRKVL